MKNPSAAKGLPWVNWPRPGMKKLQTAASTLPGLPRLIRLQYTVTGSKVAASGIGDERSARLDCGMRRSLPRLHDDERLLAVPVKDDDDRAVRVELLRDLLEVLGGRDRLIVDCLDNVARLQVFRKL
jgi:hypothetical protein